MYKPRAHGWQHGFNTTETLIAIFILLLLLTLGFTSFIRAKKTKVLDTVSDGLNFTLEQARSASLSGRDSNTFGVYITSSNFVLFDGASYSALSKNNKITNIPAGWMLATSTGLTNSSIVFQRLTGTPNNTATVTVSRIDEPSLSRQIVVGSDGAVSVIK